MYFILPISIATIEHAFVNMNIDNTKLRNKIEDDFLEHCLVIFIAREIVKTFSIHLLMHSVTRKSGKLYFRL